MKGRQPTRILIIDADNVRRGMLACSLPTSSYALDFAKTPSEGLDKIQRAHPDVILIGNDSGTADLCQRISALPAASKALVVLMDESFKDEAAGSAEAEAIGADLALAFPFAIEQLEARLQRRRKRRQSQAIYALHAPERQLAATVPGATNGLPGGGAAQKNDNGEWIEFRARVARLHGALDTFDYYQLLELPHGASAAEVKTAYFERSIEFHPDRFMRLEDENLKLQLYDLFKRYTEAFKVLMDPNARAEYEEQLALPVPGGSREVRYMDIARPHRPSPAEEVAATTPAGRRYLQLAELAERKGNLKSARMYLTLATQVEPTNDVLRHQLDLVTSRLRG